MKLLADVDGAPLLSRTIASLFDAGITHVVLVVSPEHRLGCVAVLSDPRVSAVTNPDPARGMFSSIQIGFAAAAGDPLVVLPADMPFVPGDVIGKLIAATDRLDASVVPVHDGRRGHPVVIPGRFRSAILAAPPSSNLKAALLAATGSVPQEVPVNSPGVVRDVDVPADLEERPS